MAFVDDASSTGASFGVLTVTHRGATAAIGLSCIVCERLERSDDGVQGGEYPVDVSIALQDGLTVTLSGRIAVAEPILIEPSKALTPGEVAPDPAGARIRIDSDLDAIGE